MRRGRMLVPLAVVALAAAGGTAAASTPDAAEAAAPPPLGAPGDVSRIDLIGTSSEDGWTYRTYRNEAYPCSIDGYQTFTIGTRQGGGGGTAPLWVYMHGGGIGYFDAAGDPQPNIKHMTEEPAARQIQTIQEGPLTQRVLDAQPGSRVLAVSMCNRDIYGGVDQLDPNNDGTTPDGRPRTTNGLFATKAAVQFTTTRYATDDYFLYGGSAGSYGSFHVGFGLQQQGLAPAGIIADSGVMNVSWLETTQPSPICGRSEDAAEIIPQRLHPSITATSSGPDRQVASGAFRVPIVDVWSINDPGQCGVQQIDCPLPNGSSVRLGSVDCMHEPLRRAIAAQGPDSRSASMRLCVSVPGAPQECTRHVPTGYAQGVNTLPGQPADYNGAIVRWVQQRLADD